MILQGVQKTRGIAVKLPPQTYARYFTPKTPQSEIEKTVELALALYFSRQERTEESEK